MLNLTDVRDGVARWVAYRLPRRVVYFAAIRLGAHATGSPEHAHTEVPELRFVDALERWQPPLGTGSLL